MTPHTFVNGNFTLRPKNVYPDIHWRVRVTQQ